MDGCFMERKGPEGGREPRESQISIKAPPWALQLFSGWISSLLGFYITKSLKRNPGRAFCGMGRETSGKFWGHNFRDEMDPLPTYECRRWTSHTKLGANLNFGDGRQGIKSPIILIFIPPPTHFLIINKTLPSSVSWPPPLHPSLKPSLKYFSSF